MSYPCELTSSKALETARKQLLEAAKHRTLHPSHYPYDAEQILFVKTDGSQSRLMHCFECGDVWAFNS